MNDIQWDKIKLAEFRSLVFLTEEENQVLEDWARGHTKAWISAHRNMSERTVGSVLSRLRSLYDGVEPFTPLLPPRNIPGKRDGPSHDGRGYFYALIAQTLQKVCMFSSMLSVTIWVGRSW